MSEIKTNTRRVKYKPLQDRVFKDYPSAEEVLSTLIEKTKDEMEKNEVNKRVSIHNWSDIAFARYDEKRFFLKEILEYLVSLEHDVEIADIEHDLAIDGAEVPF